MNDDNFGKRRKLIHDISFEFFECHFEDKNSSRAEVTEKLHVVVLRKIANSF